MKAKTDFEKVSDFLKQYPPVLEREGLSFDVTVSQLFIESASEILNIDGDVLKFKADKYYGLDSLVHLINQEISVELDVTVLQRRGVHVYKNWASFLKKVTNRVSSPDSFIIVNENLLYPRDSSDMKIRHYLDIVSFISILWSSKDYSIGPDKLVFLHKSNIQFEIRYDEQAVESGLDGVSVVLEMFKGEEHAGQKKSLLKETLYGMLVNINESDRFPFLLSNFGAFSTQVTQSYHLFVSEFSFEDIRREYEEKTRSYVTEINKVFADVQTRMLGVPAILALAAFRFSSISKPDQFWPNLIIFIAVIIYVYMMFFLIRSQQDTLGAIKREIRSQMKRFRKDYQKEGRLIRVFEDRLENRCDRQNSILKGFYVIIGILFIVTMVLFIWSFVESDFWGNSLESSANKDPEAYRVTTECREPADV